MSAPDVDARPASGSRWSTRRWLVLGLVVVLLVVWFALRYAYAAERQDQYYGTTLASLDKAWAEMQRQAALPADQRSVDRLEQVVGIDIKNNRSQSLLTIAVEESDLSGTTQYAVVSATSRTPDLAALLGVEGRYTELLVAGSYGGGATDQWVCVLRVDQPTYARTTEALEWGPITIAPCTDEQVAASGIAR